MKHKVLAMAALLLAVCGMQAQTRVERFNIPADINSIIRTVDDEYSLIYLESKSCFLLYNQGSATAKVFYVPSLWQVHDVRVWNGTDAYFCGKYGSQTDSAGLIGTFPIFPTFDGAGGINYAYCGWEGTDSTVKPIDLKRLDLFEIGGIVNMAMVGSSLTYKEAPYANTTVTSAYLSANNWHICSYVNKGSYIMHTDIACLDDVIVSVGTDLYGSGCRMKTFRKMSDFPQNPVAIADMHEVVYGAPKGKVLATHEEGNQAVLVHYNKGNNGYTTVFHRVDFSSTTGAPVTIPLDTWESTSPSNSAFNSSWDMVELNWDKDVAWLLQWADYSTAVMPGVTDWLQAVSLPSTTATVSKAWHPQSCKSHSMDVCGYTTFPWLSGNRLEMIVYEPWWAMVDGTCHSYDKIQFDYGQATWRRSLIDDGYGKEFTPGTLYIVSVSKVDVSVICAQ